jgi:ABC-type multidrug transport system fused ATPase/permease subunit
MRNIIKFRFAGIFIMLAAIAVFSVVVMLLWNALLPQLFALPTLSYWQAAGLLILARILFGGLVHDMADGRMRGNHNFHHGNKLREKWMNMSAEERKEFMEKEKDFFKFNRGFSRFHEFFDDENGNKKDDRNE